MAGPEPMTLLNEGTSNQNTTKSIIEGHVSALKELLKEPSNRDLIKPMLLDFDDIQDDRDEEIKVNKKGKEKVGDEDLSKPFKEVLKCPFTKRIVEFSSSGHRMLANAKIYDRTGDSKNHVGRFVGMGNQGEWPLPVWCRIFNRPSMARFGMLKACDKDPMEILKIVRRANETLPKFKERWVSESNNIPNVPELMQISSFMSSHKCPEMSKRFSDNIPKTVDEMLKRVDDYLRSKEAFLQQVEPSGERCKAKGKRGQWNSGPQKGKGKWAMLEGNNGETPYSLTFRSEAVIPIEIGIPTHRTMMVKKEGGNKEEMRLNLDLLQKRREAVAI
ncbi:hypothetical protein Tco_0111151 [Tanacetum coccineum]